LVEDLFLERLWLAKLSVPPIKVNSTANLSLDSFFGANNFRAIQEAINSIVVLAHDEPLPYLNSHGA
jgi:hypothetical protein